MAQYMSGHTGLNIDEMISLVPELQRQLNELQAQVTAQLNSTVENLNNTVDNKIINLTNQVNDYWKTVYPIGSVYISLNNTSPETLFGGAWTKITDTFLWASGTESVGATGGEKQVSLTLAQGPAHTHTRGTMEITGKFRAYSEYNLNNTAYQNYVGGAISSEESYGTSSNLASGSNDAVRMHYFTASNAWTGETSSSGESQPHNNMPPYLVVNMWKRIA